MGNVGSKVADRCECTSVRPFGGGLGVRDAKGGYDDWMGEGIEALMVVWVVGVSVGLGGRWR